MLLKHRLNFSGKRWTHSRSQCRNFLCVRTPKFLFGMPIEWSEG